MVVGDDREAHLDGAGAAGHGDVIDGLVGVDEGVDAVEGVLMEAVPVTGLDVAEDHGGADDQADDMADGPDVLAHGNHTDGEAHGHALLHGLLDDAADQEDEDTAGLIALDGLHSLFRRGSGADHDDEAGDIAGDQGHAQFTDFGVDEVAVVRVPS